MLDGLTSISRVVLCVLKVKQERYKKCKLHSKTKKNLYSISVPSHTFFQLLPPSICLLSFVAARFRRTDRPVCSTRQSLSPSWPGLRILAARLPQKTTPWPATRHPLPFNSFNRSTTARSSPSAILSPLKATRLSLSRSPSRHWSKPTLRSSMREAPVPPRGNPPCRPDALTYQVQKLQVCGTQQVLWDQCLWKGPDQCAPLACQSSSPGERHWSVMGSLNYDCGHGDRNAPVSW